jgi:quercetin dioxygenase-like cupin family protein
MLTPLWQDLPPGLRDPERRTVTNVLFKDKAVFLEYSHETGGTHTRSALTLEAGGGNPQHFHRTYAEHFHCISGKLSVELGRNPKIDLQPGESLLVPIRQNYRFFNATDETVEAEITIYLVMWASKRASTSPTDSRMTVCATPTASHRISFICACLRAFLISRCQACLGDWWVS